MVGMKEKKTEGRAVDDLLMKLRLFDLGLLLRTPPFRERNTTSAFLKASAFLVLWGADSAGLDVGEGAMKSATRSCLAA